MIAIDPLNLTRVMPAEGECRVYFSAIPARTSGSDGMKVAQAVKTTKLSLTAILIAQGVGLSFYPGPIPLGPTLVFPFQSMINTIAGILLGPLYAALVALLVGVTRMSLHTGTVYSLPGGIPGALLVGYAYRLTKSYFSAFAEIPGTALVGALLSAFLVAPVTGSKATALFFIVAFTPPAVIGSVIGYAIMLALRRRGVVAKLPL